MTNTVTWIAQRIYSIATVCFHSFHGLPSQTFTCQSVIFQVTREAIANISRVSKNITGFIKRSSGQNYENVLEFCQLIEQSNQIHFWVSTASAEAGKQEATWDSLPELSMNHAYALRQPLWTEGLARGLVSRGKVSLNGKLYLFK